MIAQFKVLDKADPRPKIIYLGDSITDQMKVEEALTFKGGRVVNRSVSGDTTLGVLRRIGATLPDNVEVCLVLVGINDLARGEKPAAVAARIESIARTLTERGVKHVVVESILPAVRVADLRVAETNVAIRTIPQRVRSTTYLDLVPGFYLSGERDISQYYDGVHLNERGMWTRLRLESAHLAEVLPHLAAKVNSGQ